MTRLLSSTPFMYVYTNLTRTLVEKREKRGSPDYLRFGTVESLVDNVFGQGVHCQSFQPPSSVYILGCRILFNFRTKIVTSLDPSKIVISLVTVHGCTNKSDNQPIADRPGNWESVFTQSSVWEPVVDLFYVIIYTSVWGRSLFESRTKKKKKRTSFGSPSRGPPRVYWRVLTAKQETSETPWSLTT